MEENKTSKNNKHAV